MYPADRARRHAYPEPEEQFRATALFTPGDIVACHPGDAALEVRREPRPSRARPPAPEQAERVAVPPEKRRWLDDGEGLAPGEAAREEDQCEPERIRGPPRFHLPLAGEGQPLPEEELLRRQRCPRMEPRRHAPHEIDSDRSCYPAQMHDWLDVSHEDGLPASGWKPRHMESKRDGESTSLKRLADGLFADYRGNTGNGANR